MKKISTSLLIISISLAANCTLASPKSHGATTMNNGSTHNPSQSQAIENSNGKYSRDRETGLDRAEERMSEEGKKHNNAHKRKKSDWDDKSQNRNKTGNKD